MGGPPVPRRALARLAVVVVIDDAHWAEPGLLDLLAEAIRRSDAPARCCWCAWRGPSCGVSPGLVARVALIELEPLSAESRLLIDEVGRRARRRRTAAGSPRPPRGNPLFLEQLATYVDDTAARGRAAARHPGRCWRHGSTCSSPAERAVLCYGSIQGDEFTADTVHALAEGAPLAEIEAGMRGAGPARAAGRRPATLRFRHALIREAAYGSLSKAARARLHERHADRLARLAGTRPRLEAQVGFQLEAAYRCAGRSARRQAARWRCGPAGRSGGGRGAPPERRPARRVGLLERAIRLPRRAPSGAAAASRRLPPRCSRPARSSGRRRSPTRPSSRPAARCPAVAGPRAGRAGAAAGLPGAGHDRRRGVDEVADGPSARSSARRRPRPGAGPLPALRAALDGGGDPEAGYASAERMLECAGRAGSGFEASAASASWRGRSCWA